MHGHRSSAGSSTTTSSYRSTGCSAKGQRRVVAMDLLPFERSTALWYNAAYLRRRLEQLVERARGGARPGALVTRCSCSPPSGPGRAPRSSGWRPASGSAGDLDRQGAGGRRRTERLRVGRDGLGADVLLGDDTRAAVAQCTSSRDRRPSTAAASRSSATSSPAGCSASGTTADGATSSSFPLDGGPRHRGLHRWGLDAAWRTSGGRRPGRHRPVPSRCSSNTRGGRPPHAAPSSTWCRRAASRQPSRPGSFSRRWAGRPPWHEDRRVVARTRTARRGAAGRLGRGAATGRAVRGTLPTLELEAGGQGLDPGLGLVEVTGSVPMGG